MLQFALTDLLLVRGLLVLLTLHSRTARVGTNQPLTEVVDKSLSKFAPKREINAVFLWRCGSFQFTFSPFLNFLLTSYIQTSSNRVLSVQVKHLTKICNFSPFLNFNFYSSCLQYIMITSITESWYICT